MHVGAVRVGLLPSPRPRQPGAAAHAVLGAGCLRLAAARLLCVNKGCDPIRRTKRKADVPESLQRFSLITGDGGVDKSHEAIRKAAGPSPLTHLHTGGTASDPGRTSGTRRPRLVWLVPTRQSQITTWPLIPFLSESKYVFSEKQHLCASVQVTSCPQTTERSRWQGQNLSAAYAWHWARGFARLSSFTGSGKPQVEQITCR